MGFIIAIDGPCGSGKGTIASILADRLNLLNIDTGAMYRCLALFCLRNNIALDEDKKIIEASKKIDIKMDKNMNVYLNNEDVTKLIRSKEVSSIVSYVSSIPEVRDVMVELQRKMASDNDVIMEGRDITTVVFPNANYKFYLDATLEERARRRFEQNKENNIAMSFDEVIYNIRKRDYNDMHKKVGSLKIADDAIYIDTTNLSIDEVVDKMLDIINR